MASPPPPPSTSALSSLEAMLNSLMEMTEEGDETPRVGALGSPAPPLPARPPPRGRRPSLPRLVGAAVPWTPPPSPHKRDGSPVRRRKEDAGGAGADEEDPAVVEELERKATEAEEQLKLKEEENAALRRRIEGYHVRWLEYEIKIKSLEETFDEQMASLQVDHDICHIFHSAKHNLQMAQHGIAISLVQMARDAAGMAGETPPYGRRRESSESHMKMSEEATATARRRRDGGARRSAAAALVEPLPWQPSAPSASSMGDLKKLKSQFRAWKKDYKARLRRAKAELDSDRRRTSSCWI